MHRPMERHDGLPGAGRARDARRAAVLPFDELPLGRVQKDGPLLPGVVQRALQRLHIRHHPEAALRVRMRERIGARHGRRRTVGRTARRKLQQRLGGLARQVIGEVEQRVLRRGPHVVQPLDRHAVAQQVVVRRAGEDRGPRRRWSTSHRVPGWTLGRPPLHTAAPESRGPSHGSRRVAQPRSLDAVPAAVVRPTDRRRRDDRRSRAGSWKRCGG